MIKLNQDTIDNKDIDSLCKWLKTYPKLTQGELVVKFREKFADYIGTQYSVFVNSGSSANLAMIYALKLSGRLKNNKIVVPDICWSTTISPIIQLGLTPIICDIEKDTLGIDYYHFEEICKKENPGAVIIVNPLGFPCQMKEISFICKKYDVILLEDSCETIGSTYNHIKAGNFGLMSTFSLFYGHHISTIEGGFITTNDNELKNILLMIIEHGWDRNADSDKQSELRNKYKVNKFESLYTFFYPGFNFRNTEIAAHIGLNQLKKLPNIVKKRERNFWIYQSLIRNSYWKINPNKEEVISNFAYPIIHPRKNEIVKKLNQNNIECRPLICGSISNQPFYKNLYGEASEIGFGKIVDKYGLYVPNHPYLKENEIVRICEIINGEIN